MTLEEQCMRRCFELARMGEGRVSPNPMVGALLWHEGRILGEGFHLKYGEAHAEVRAIASVPEGHKHLVRGSTLFVSLEPCCFFGKTPPCTRLILDSGIRKVYVSCLDDSPEVAGKGVALLRENGVGVEVGLLAEEGKQLSAPRSVFVRENRPYVVLKFARSRNGLMGLIEEKQLWISNPLSRRLAHRWRAEVDAILIGTRTARIDDPALNTRFYPGKNPLRVVLDRQGSLPAGLQVFDGSAPTLLVSEKPTDLPRKEGLENLNLTFDDRMLPNLLKALYKRKVGMLMVEGGSRLLHSFLELGLWDEARVLTGSTYISGGIPAPAFSHAPVWSRQLGNDRIDLFQKNSPR